MCICLRDTFLELKNSYKWALGEWGFIFCLRFRHHFFFQAYQILRFSDFEKNFFWILRFHRKMCRLFPCIPIFKGFF